MQRPPPFRAGVRPVADADHPPWNALRTGARTGRTAWCAVRTARRNPLRSWTARRAPGGRCVSQWIGRRAKCVTCPRLWIERRTSRTPVGQGWTERRTPRASWPLPPDARSTVGGSGRPSWTECRPFRAPAINRWRGRRALSPPAHEPWTGSGTRTALSRPARSGRNRQRGPFSPAGTPRTCTRRIRPA